MRAEEFGTWWERVPPDGGVTAFEGNESDLYSPCAIDKKIPTKRASGVHYAGPKDNTDDGARPQWYETIAEFEDVEAIDLYIEEILMACEANGYERQLFKPRLGSITLYMTFQRPMPFHQKHHLLLVKHERYLMQVRFAEYSSSADPERFRTWAMRANEGFTTLAPYP